MSNLWHCLRQPHADERAAEIYQDTAYFTGEKEYGYSDYVALHKAQKPHFLRRPRILERYLSPPGRLVDVGCADGYFLELARTLGWEVVGVEVSKPMAQVAGQRLETAVVDTIEQFPDSYFDVVTLWETLEHLPDPLAQLQAIRRRIRPGGVLMLSTPNVGHWQASREPLAWSEYKPPAHLVLFNKTSLALALEKAGFSQIRIWKTSPLPALPSALQKLTAPLYRALQDGSARPWGLALILWRVVRLAGWMWQRISRPEDDIFVGLEAIARRSE